MYIDWENCERIARVYFYAVHKRFDKFPDELVRVMHWYFCSST